MEAFAHILEYANGCAMMALGFFIVADWLVKKDRRLPPVVIVSLGLFLHGFHHIVLHGTIIGDIGDFLIWIGALLNFIFEGKDYKE